MSVRFSLLLLSSLMIISIINITFIEAETNSASASSSCFSRSNRGRHSCFQVSSPEISYLLFSTVGDARRETVGDNAVSASQQHRSLPLLGNVTATPKILRILNKFRTLQNTILYPQDTSAFPVFVQARTIESEQALNSLSKAIKNKNLTAKVVMKRVPVAKSRRSQSSTAPLLSLSDLLLKDEEESESTTTTTISENLYFNCHSPSLLASKTESSSSKSKNKQESTPLMVLHCSLDYSLSNIAKIKRQLRNDKKRNDDENDNDEEQHSFFQQLLLGRSQPYHSWLVIEEEINPRRGDINDEQEDSVSASSASSSLLPLLALPISPFEQAEVTRPVREQLMSSFLLTQQQQQQSRSPELNKNQQEIASLTNNQEIEDHYKKLFSTFLKKNLNVRARREQSTSEATPLFSPHQKEQHHQKNSLFHFLYPPSLKSIHLATAEPQGALRVNIATSASAQQQRSSSAAVGSIFRFNTASGGRVLDSISSSYRNKNDNKNRSSSASYFTIFDLDHEGYVVDSTSYFLLRGGVSTAQKTFLRVGLRNAALAVDTVPGRRSAPRIPMRDKAWSSEFYISKIELEYLGCDREESSSSLSSRNQSSSYKQIYTAEDKMTLPSWGGYWKIVIEMTRNYGRNLKILLSPAVVEVAGFCLGRGLSQEPSPVSNNNNKNNFFFVSTGPGIDGDMPLATAEFLLTSSLSNSSSNHFMSTIFKSLFTSSSSSSNAAAPRVSMPVELIRYSSSLPISAQLPKICASSSSVSSTDERIYRLLEIESAKFVSSSSVSSKLLLPSRTIQLHWFLRQLPDGEDYLQSGEIAAGERFAICSRKDFVASGDSSSVSESYGIISHAQHSGPTDLKIVFDQNFVSAKTQTVLPGEVVSVKVKFDTEGFALHPKSLWVEFSSSNDDEKQRGRKFFSNAMILKSSSNNEAIFTIQINESEHLRAGMCGDLFLDLNYASSSFGVQRRGEVINMTDLFSKREVLAVENQNGSGSYSSNTHTTKYKLCFRGIGTASSLDLNEQEISASSSETLDEEDEGDQAQQQEDERKKSFVATTTTRRMMKDIPFSLSSLTATRVFVRALMPSTTSSSSSSCDLLFDQSEHTVKTSVVSSTFSVILVPTITQESYENKCLKNAASQLTKSEKAFCDSNLQRVTSKCGFSLTNSNQNDDNKSISNNEIDGCNGEFSFIHQQNIIQHLIAVDWIRRTPFSVQRCEAEFRPASHVDWLANPPQMMKDERRGDDHSKKPAFFSSFVVSGWTMLYLMKHNETHHLASPIISKSFKLLGPQNVSIVFDGLKKASSTQDDDDEEDAADGDKRLNILERMKMKLKAQEWSKEEMHWETGTGAASSVSSSNNNHNNNERKIVSQFTPDYLNRVIRVCGTELNSEYDLIRIVPESVSSSRTMTQMTLDPFYSHASKAGTVISLSPISNNNRQRQQNNINNSSSSTSCVTFELPPLHIEGNVDLLYCFRCKTTKPKLRQNSKHFSEDNTDATSSSSSSSSSGELRLEDSGVNEEEQEDSDDILEHHKKNHHDYESEIMPLGSVFVLKSFDPSFEKVIASSSSSTTNLPYLIVDSPFRIILTPKSLKHAELTSDVIHASLRLVRRQDTDSDSSFTKRNEEHENNHRHDQELVTSSDDFFDCSSASSSSSSSSVSFFSSSSIHAMIKEQGGTGSLYTTRPVTVKTAGRYEMCVAFSFSSSRRKANTDDDEEEQNDETTKSSSSKTKTNNMQWVRAGSLAVVGVDESDLVAEIELENQRRMKEQQHETDEVLDPFSSSTFSYNSAFFSENTNDQREQTKKTSSSKSKQKVRVFGTSLFGGKFIGSAGSEDEENHSNDDNSEKVNKLKRKPKKQRFQRKLFQVISTTVGSSAFSIDLPVYIPSSRKQNIINNNKKNLILRFSPPRELMMTKNAAEPFFLPATSITRDSSSKMTSSSSTTATKRMIVTFSGQIPATSSTIKSLAKQTLSFSNDSDGDSDSDDFNTWTMDLGYAFTNSDQQKQKRQLNDHDDDDDDETDYQKFIKQQQKQKQKHEEQKEEKEEEEDVPHLDDFSFARIKYLRAKMKFPIHHVNLGMSNEALLLLQQKGNSSLQQNSATPLFLGGSTTNVSVGHEKISTSASFPDDSDRQTRSFDITSTVHIVFFSSPTSQNEEEDLRNSNDDICARAFADSRFRSSVSSVEFSSTNLNEKEHDLVANDKNYLLHPELQVNSTSYSEKVKLPDAIEIEKLKRTHQHRSKPNLAICFSIWMKEGTHQQTRKRTRSSTTTTSALLFSKSIHLVTISQVQSIGSQGLRGVVSLYGFYDSSTTGDREQEQHNKKSSLRTRHQKSQNIKRILESADDLQLTFSVESSSSTLSSSSNENKGDMNDNDDDDEMTIFLNPKRTKSLITAWICSSSSSEESRTCDSEKATGLVFALTLPKQPIASSSSSSAATSIPLMFTWKEDWKLENIPPRNHNSNSQRTSSSKLTPSISIRKTERIEVLSNFNTPIPPTQPLSEQTLADNYLRHKLFDWKSTNRIVTGRSPHRVTVSLDVRGGDEQVQCEKLLNGSLKLIATSGRIPDPIFTNLMFYRQQKQQQKSKQQRVSSSDLNTEYDYDLVSNTEQHHQDLLPELSSGFLQAISMRVVASGFSISAVENVRQDLDQHHRNEETEHKSTTNTNQNSSTLLYADFYTQHAGHVFIAIVDVSEHENDSVSSSSSPFIWEKTKLDRERNFVNFIFHKIGGVRAIVHEPLLRVFGIRYSFLNDQQNDDENNINNNKISTSTSSTNSDNTKNNRNKNNKLIDVRRVYIVKRLPCQVEKSIGYSENNNKNNNIDDPNAGGQAELLWTHEGVGPWISDEAMKSSTAEDVSLLLESRHTRSATARLIDEDYNSVHGDSSSAVSTTPTRHTLIATLRPMAHLIKNGDSAFVCAKYHHFEDSTNTTIINNVPLDLASSYRFNDLLDLTSSTLGRMPSLGFAVIGLNHNKIVKSVSPDSRFWYGLKEKDYQLFFRHSPSDKCPSVLPGSLLRKSQKSSSSSSSSNSLSPAIPLPSSMTQFLIKQNLLTSSGSDSLNQHQQQQKWLFQVAGAGHYCAYITHAGFSLNCGKVHIPGPLYSTALAPSSSSSTSTTKSTVSACSSSPTSISTRVFLVAGQELEYPMDFLFLSAPPRDVLNRFFAESSNHVHRDGDNEQLQRNHHHHPCEFQVQDSVAKLFLRSTSSNNNLNNRHHHYPQYPISAKDVRYNREISAEVYSRFNTSGTFVICAKRPISKELLAVRKKLKKLSTASTSSVGDEANSNKTSSVDIFHNWGRGVTTRPVKMQYPTKNTMSVFLSTVKVAPPTGRRFQLLSKAHYEIDVSYSYLYRSSKGRGKQSQKQNEDQEHHQQEDQAYDDDNDVTSSSQARRIVTPIKIIWTIRAFFPSSQISPTDRNALDWLFTNTKKKHQQQENLPRQCGENAGAQNWGIYVSGLSSSSTSQQKYSSKQQQKPVLLDYSSSPWVYDGHDYDDEKEQKKNQFSHYYHPAAIASTWKRTFETNFSPADEFHQKSSSPSNKNTTNQIKNNIPEKLLSILHQWCVQGDDDDDDTTSSSASSSGTIPRDRLLLKWRLRASGLDFNEDELFDHPLRLSSCTAKRLNEEQFLARKSRNEEQTENNDHNSEEDNINDDNDRKSNIDDRQRERMTINKEQEEAEEKAAALFINSRTRKRYQRLSGRDRLLAILKSKLVGGGVGGNHHRLQDDEDDDEDESTKRETGNDHERNRKLFDRLLKTMKNDVDADDLEEKPMLLGLTRVHLILTCFGILIVAIVGLICLKRTSQPSAPSQRSVSTDQNKIEKTAKKKK